MDDATTPNGKHSNRFIRFMLALGPGIFCVGYTIGTGSVTAMAKSGSQYGMQLLWVLALSCFFSWVLMEAYGRFGVVTGRTAIHAFRTEFRHGKFLALAVAALIIIGQWCCLSGLVGLSANAIYEASLITGPETVAAGTIASYWPVLGIAIGIMAVMYWLLWIGNYGRFEKILLLFVSVMGVSFIISSMVTPPSLGQVLNGFVPRVPDAPGARIMVAAFVGTTMAAPTFVVRPLLMKGKGWGLAEARLQRRDAIVSASLMFVVCGAIMACATGAILNRGGEPINRVLDMALTLQPLAGRAAVVLFLVGTLSAGLSSIIPIAMVAPLLVSDYRDGEMRTQSRLFRALTAVACLVGLAIPILGVNPIFAQILTQISQVFVLPLVIGGISVLVNRKSLMGEHRAGPCLNLGLAASFLFSLVISYKAIFALTDLL